MSSYKSKIGNIEESIANYASLGKKMFITSSFQSHSIPLLHIITNIKKEIPVYFLDTGFHFIETLEYRDNIADLLNIEVLNVESKVSKVNQRDGNGRFYFCSNSEYCCHINKVEPLEPILLTHDIWITGVRGDQNSNRKSMSAEAKGPFDTLRYHPMLDWTSKMIYDYRKDFSLPAHPLEDKGYLSIGCQPCTQKHDMDGRGGRWSGQKKTECGLHTELINN